MTEDTLLLFDLPAVQRKKVTADFAGGSISFDRGRVLLRAAERRLGLAEALTGFRNGAFAVKLLFSIDDRRDTIVRSRSLGACGWLYPPRRGGGVPGAIEAPVQGWPIATPSWS